MAYHKEFFQNLDDRCSEAEQEEARSQIALRAGDDLRFLVMPAEGKHFWENSAKVLVAIGRPGVDSVFQDMLCWLKDLNWPGANIILDFLLKQPKDSIDQYIQKARLLAVEDGDDEWLAALEELSKQ